MTRFLLIFILTGFAFIPVEAKANIPAPANPFAVATPVQPEVNKETQLTEKNMRNLIDAINLSYMKPLKEFMSFMDQHIGNDFTLSHDTVLYFPGKPPMPEKETANREDFMKALPANREILQGAKIQSNILDIKLSSDRRSATLKDETITETILPIQGRSSGRLKVKMKQKSICDNTISISKDDVIQMDKSVCKSETRITHEIVQP